MDYFKRQEILVLLIKKIIIISSTMSIIILRFMAQNPYFVLNEHGNSMTENRIYGNIYYGLSDVPMVELLHLG